MLANLFRPFEYTIDLPYISRLFEKWRIYDQIGTFFLFFIRSNCNEFLLHMSFNQCTIGLRNSHLTKEDSCMCEQVSTDLDK